MKVLARITIICLLTLAILSAPARALTLNKDVKVVLTTGIYGLAVGTAAGLVSYPISKSPRTVFIGSSVGLYLGIAVGIYHIFNRDDPGNPLRSEAPPLLELPQDTVAYLRVLNFEF